MPIKRPCNSYPCPELVEGKASYCDGHQKQRRADSNRARTKTEWQKWYHSKEWQSIRTKQLTQYPWCQFSLPDGTICNDIATQVDHIIPLEDGGQKGPPNIQSGCVSCHSRKTMYELKAKGY